jgi:hypothetical protein
MATQAGTTPFMPPEVEAELDRLRWEIAGKQIAIAQSEAEHASLVAEDAALCAALNETVTLAALPKPRTLDYARVEDWHSANRKWAANCEHVNRALPGLEADRNRKVASVQLAARRIIGLRFELIQLEFEHAKAEHLTAQIHLNTMAALVQQRRLALLTAPQA